MVSATGIHQLHRCLDRVRFPANKNDLLSAAIGGGCDEATIEALRAVAPMTYVNAAQVCASVTVVDAAGTDDGT